MRAPAAPPPGAVYVYDGMREVGSLVYVRPDFFARDADGRDLGTFRTVTEARRAVLVAARKVSL